MNDISHLFNYFARNFQLDHHELGIATFSVDDTGPVLGTWDNNPSMEFIMNTDFLRNFVVYSMMASTQGSYYQDSIITLPVARYPSHHALIISFVKDGKEFIHYRYVQVVIFLPSTIAKLLPAVIDLEDELFQDIKRIQLDDQVSLEEFKHKIVELLETKL